MGELRAYMLLICSVVTLPAVGVAQDPVVRVIPPGRETQVMALFAPHGLGSELGGGFQLADVGIDGGELMIQLRHPSAGEVTVRLHHASAATPMARRMGVLAATLPPSPPDAAGPAIATLLQVLQTNQAGAQGLWVESQHAPAQHLVATQTSAQQGGPSSRGFATPRAVWEFSLLLGLSLLSSVALLLWLLWRRQV